MSIPMCQVVQRLVRLSSSMNDVHESNSNITKAQLNIASEDDTYWDNLRKWARGVDIADYDDDGNTTETRKELGDPLHSRPVIVTYGQIRWRR